eukprot:1139405-Pelagomonas_calceolata.AAC.3
MVARQNFNIIRNLEEKGTPVDKQRKQQILADILVWAEITQAHYNQEVQRVENLALFVEVWLFNGKPHKRLAQDLQQLGQAQAWMAVEEEEEMGQEEGSSSEEDWFTGDENDAE